MSIMKTKDACIVKRAKWLAERVYKHNSIGECNVFLRKLERLEKLAESEVAKAFVWKCTCSVFYRKGILEIAENCND